MKKELISKRANRIARSLGIHPGLKFKDDRAVIESIWIGNTKRAYKRYIHKAFPVDSYHSLRSGHGIGSCMGYKHNESVYPFDPINIL